MAEPIPELSLAWCVGLTVAAFGSAGWFAVRRMTASRSQAAVDAVVLGYAVQYAAVALPGLVGLLGPGSMTAVALALSAALGWAAHTAPRPATNPAPIPRPPLAVLGFAAVFIVGFAYLSSPLPLAADDALTYHFPAAVQWLQTGRLGLFPTWFFNPANTYSPLAGSTFIAWLLAPFGSDVVARFVEVPAAVGVVAAVFAVGRQLGGPAVAAAFCAAGAGVARPFVTASIMGKDDLFVALFFAAAVLALHPTRAAERFGATRLGVAVGLLLATKYTALLAAPVLLVAVDGPWRAGWRWRQWVIAFATVAVFAGPWHVRNAVLTSNPFFPIRVAGLHGLFTTARSQAFADAAGAARVVVGGQYGLPPTVLLALAVAWVLVLVFDGRDTLRDPTRRTCLFGPVVAAVVFYAASPYPESRFLYPAFTLLFAAAAATALPAAGALVVGLAVFSAALVTSSTPEAAEATELLTTAGGVAVAGGWAVDRLTRSWPATRRVGLLVGGPFALLAASVYVYWPGYCLHYRDSFAGIVHPRLETATWAYLDANVPPDATVAYAGTYFVYPLQGPGLGRRVVYVPTRRGVRTMADLPDLGTRLPGERIVPAARAATVADADERQWLAAVTATGATYLVLFTNVIDVPERRMADRHPDRFTPVFIGGPGRVYRIGP